MKNLLKKFVIYALGFCARLVIKRYRPTIVMVTGSVGKTSTKDAVAAVLDARFYVRKSEKSFNSEFGVPFTILGVGNPWCNAFAWVKLAKNALALVLLPNHYPNLLVLETGADQPGDLTRILRLAIPDMVVVTRLPDVPVHVEAYGCPDHVRDEEFSPAYALAPAAPLVISADDPYSRNCARRLPACVISYGCAPDSSVRVTDIGFFTENGRVLGMRATAAVGEDSLPIIVKGSVGKTQIFPISAALAVASAFSIPTADAMTALVSYEPPPGRGRILDGVNGTTVIDDSYNSSPAAVEEALETLSQFPRHTPHGGRHIAVLGDMLELGRYSVAEHERIAALAGEKADVVVGVGIRSRAFAAASKDAETLLFDNSRAAAAALPALVREGDVILVKGSQSIRMERVVEALLADPSDISKLVRQEPAWKRKP